MKKFRSIKYHLLITMSLIFLIFVTLVLNIWYYTLKRQAESTAIANMEASINIANTAFENQVQDICNITALTTVQTGSTLSTNILNIMSQDSLSDSEIIEYRRNATDYLISLCSFKKYLNGLMLCNFKGEDITYGNPTTFDIISQNKWTSLLSDTSSQIVFIKPHYPREWYNNENDLVFSVMKPVYDHNQTKIGFAIADINCQLFDDSFESASSKNNSLYILDNISHNVIFSSQSNLLHLDQEDSFSPEICAKFKKSSGNFFITIEGTSYLVVYHKSSLTNWNTINIIPQEEIISEFSSTAKNMLMITIILLFLMTIIIYQFSSILTNNISTLTTAVKKIDANNLSLDVSITSKDEVADLTRQFQYMLTRITDLLNEIRQKEAEKRTAEISALQFQMNPHFLYNSLNTIQFLASIQGIDNIENVAKLLSSLMYTNMDGRTYLTVAEDIHFIESYLELQTYRHTNIFNYEIIADDNVLSYQIPKLLVQPLVENALKHGLAQKQTDGFITICYKISNNMLHVCVKDNGIGITSERITEIFSKNQNANAGHIGIFNIRERIKLYYGDDYGISVNSIPQTSTCFEITLPLIKEVS